MARPLNQEARERARRRAEAFLGIALGDIEDAHGLPHVYAYVLDKTDGDAKWLYIGRHIGTKADYMGSGRAWVKAIDAHGVHHVHRFLIETCEAPDALGRCTREQYWLDYGFANAERRAAIFNLARESGGGFHAYKIRCPVCWPVPAVHEFTDLKHYKAARASPVHAMLINWMEVPPVDGPVGQAIARDLRSIVWECCAKHVGDEDAVAEAREAAREHIEAVARAPHEREQRAATRAAKLAAYKAALKEHEEATKALDAALEARRWPAHLLLGVVAALGLVAYSGGQRGPIAVIGVVLGLVTTLWLLVLMVRGLWSSWRAHHIPLPEVPARPDEPEADVSRAGDWGEAAGLTWPASQRYAIRQGTRRKRKAGRR